MAEDREVILADEVLIVRNSGEIPEIALYGSLYYLTEDEDGPRFCLRDDELQSLYDAALARAREIVLRDLDPANRDLRLYRGVARTIVNWWRLQNLCRRIKRDCPGFREVVTCALLDFFYQEINEVTAGARPSSVNCSAADLHAFIGDLHISPAALPAGWQDLCRE
ncbi:MAG: hypothetical protein GWP11_01505 [Proteobacteria bacterium]|nr:hypothetical protein [Pseudomonadota bacterium]